MDTLTTITDAYAPLVADTAQAARMMGCSVSVVYRHLAAGDLRRIRHGRRTVIPIADLHQLIEKLANAN